MAPPSVLAIEFALPPLAEEKIILRDETGVKPNKKVIMKKILFCRKAVCERELSPPLSRGGENVIKVER